MPTVGPCFPLWTEKGTFNGTCPVCPLNVKFVQGSLKIKSGYPFLMNILEISECQ
jgi:hypothetical protein